MNFTWSSAAVRLGNCRWIVRYKSKTYLNGLFVRLYYESIIKPSNNSSEYFY